MPFIPGIPALDLFAAFLIASAFRERYGRLVAIAIAGALFIDVFSAMTPIGISAVVYGGIVLGSRAAGQFFHIRTFSIPAIIIATGSLALRVCRLTRL